MQGKRSEPERRQGTAAPLDGPEWSRDAPHMDPREHEAPWGRAPRFSESGDEGSDGDVSPETADYVATEGNRRRLTAEERAASFQRPLGTPPSKERASPDAVPEARDNYGLGRPGFLDPERRRERPGMSEGGA